MQTNKMLYSKWQICIKVYDKVCKCAQVGWNSWKYIMLTTDEVSLYWPRRPGRAARQHWQIRSARFFCVWAEPVEQAATGHLESVR